jgi:hypothetical protein
MRAFRNTHEFATCALRNETERDGTITGKCCRRRRSNLQSDPHTQMHSHRVRMNRPTEDYVTTINCLQTECGELRMNAEGLNYCPPTGARMLTLRQKSAPPQNSSRNQRTQNKASEDPLAVIVIQPQRGRSPKSANHTLFVPLARTLL